ncbi:hypothetical protein ETU10_01150 [Apibacter muscae]|uniref:hypothetical protein n=1 Tax=Apibacter muscae TaxID=2509004 RepID=UPI0011ABCE05|nr:hypothetical protein [Apibacter muscae]TWP25270.1 hypothetical protein ETU10_01150 [Apibacter muscae]
MGKSYIPKDKVFAVCTYQLSSAPQKFSNTREKPTVFYKNNQQPVLNIEDRNLDNNFTCKSPANILGSIIAFGAGLALALSGPVGWIVAGVAIAATAAVLYTVYVHKCTSPLSKGQWHLTHSSVRINGKIAVTGASLLKCGTGGILTPFFSEAAAKQAASDVASNNRWELGLNIVGSFAAGLSLPGAFSSVGAATTIGGKLTAGGILIRNMGAGYVAFSVLAWGERGAIRGYHENLGELKDSETYANMNKVEGNDIIGSPEKPDDLFQDGTDLINPPASDSSPEVKVEYVQKLTAVWKAGGLVIDDIALANKLDQLAGLSKPQLRTNPIAIELMQELSNPNKHTDWKNSMRYPNTNRMNPSMVEDGRAATAQSYKNNLKELGKKGAEGILFLLPFVATWFSENARASLAKALANDASDVSLIAMEPLK